jgi:LysM repeat protein
MSMQYAEAAMRARPISLRWAGAALVLSTLTACLPGQGGSSPSPSASTGASTAAKSVATLAPPPPTPTTTPPQNAYTVKSGDTLSGIAAQNGTTVDAIVKANDLQDPDMIQTGQQLVLPSSSAAAPAPSAAPAASGATSLPAAASKPPPP